MAIFKWDNEGTEPTPKQSSGGIFSWDTPATPAATTPMATALATLPPPKQKRTLIDKVLGRNKGPVFSAPIGENLSPEQTEKALEIVRKTNTAPGTEIKIPFSQKVLKANAGPVESLTKEIVEWPERVVNTIGEAYRVITNKAKKEEDGKLYSVPSHFEIKDEFAKTLVENGMTDTQADWIATLYAGSAAILDIAALGGLLKSGVTSITSRQAVKNESQLAAQEFLGNPKTLQEAEVSFRKIQQISHPDKPTGNIKVSQQANDAIKILRATGVSDANSLRSKVTSAIGKLNEPVSSLFKKKGVSAVADDVARTAIPARTTITKQELKPIVRSIKKTGRVVEPVKGPTIKPSRKEIADVAVRIPKTPAKITKGISKELEPLAEEVRKYNNAEEIIPAQLKNIPITESKVFGSSIKGSKYNDIDVAVFVPEGKYPTPTGMDTVKHGNIEYHIFPDTKAGRDNFTSLAADYKGDKPTISSLSDFFSKAKGKTVDKPVESQKTLETKAQKGKSYPQGKKITIEEAKKHIYKEIPESDIRVVFDEKLIEEGARGMYIPTKEGIKGLFKPMIELYVKDGKVSPQTVFHEMYHFIEDNFFTAAEKKLAIDLAKKEMGPLSRMKYRKYLDEDARRQEFMADKYADYKKNQDKYKTSPWRKIFLKLDKILKAIVDTVKKIGDSIKDLYQVYKDRPEGGFVKFFDDGVPTKKSLADLRKAETTAQANLDRAVANKETLGDNIPALTKELEAIKQEIKEVKFPSADPKDALKATEERMSMGPKTYVEKGLSAPEQESVPYKNRVYYHGISGKRLEKFEKTGEIPKAQQAFGGEFSITDDFEIAKMHAGDNGKIIEVRISPDASVSYGDTMGEPIDDVTDIGDAEFLVSGNYAVTTGGRPIKGKSITSADEAGLPQNSTAEGKPTISKSLSIKEDISVIETAELEAIDQEYTDLLKEGDREFADEVRSIRELRLTEDETVQQIGELKLSQEFMKESLSDAPAKELAKYANKRTGELPEVLGKGPGKFARTGDEIAMDLGFKDSEEARAAFDDYSARRKQFLEQKDYISQRVKNFREKKAIIEAVEKQIRAEGRNRMQTIIAIQDFFHLTDKEMKEVMRGNPDLRLMDDKKYEDLLKGIKGRAYEAMRHNEAMMAIENTIFNKELKKVENLRQALRLRQFKNMTVGELEEFNTLLDTYQKGDEFLGPRQIQTAKLTDLGEIKTRREALEKLAQEAKVPLEDVQNIEVKSKDKFLYDVAFARQNPLYKIMVDNVNRSTVEAGGRFYDAKRDVETLFAAARKSRVRSLGQKLVPTDQLIFDYLSNGGEVKLGIAKQMTPEEIRAAMYVQEKYSDMRDFLVNQGTLDKYRINYVTHIRRSFLEALKDTGKGVFTKEGLKGLVGELFDTHKLQRANFNIMNDKTGEVLPLEKFFKFSLQRSGNLIPTKNVAKAFLEYYRTFEKKRELDSFIPKIDIFAHVLTPAQMTKRGLIKNDTLRVFIRKWLNTKKGRVVDTGIVSPGDFMDTAARSGVALTRLLDLGLNIPVGIASNLGAQTATFIPLGAKAYTTGVTRSLTKKGKTILTKYESIVGERLIEKLRDASKDIGNKTSEIIFGLFSVADRKAKSVFLLGKMTPEEFAKGELSVARQSELRNEMGRYHVVPGMESIIGKTALGAVFKQYKSWAIPLLHTTTNNFKIIQAMLRRGENPMKSQEFKELLRASILASFILLVGYKTYTELKNKKNRSFTENLAFKSMNDSLSIMGALDPSVWTKVRLLKFLDDMTTSLSNVSVGLVTGVRTKEGKVQGLSTLGQTIEPKFLKALTQEEKTPLDEALASENADTQATRTEAEEKWAELKKLAETSKEEANAAFLKLEEENPDLADRVYDIGEAEKLGLTEDDRKIKSLGVKNGNRARYIYGEVLKLDTKEEKNAYVTDLDEKGVLSDAVYEQLSEMIKAGKPLYEEGQETSEGSLIDTVSLYAKAIGTDPLTAFNRIFTGQDIRRIDNGAIIVERISLAKSQARKRKLGATTGMILDHTIPLQLGGSNGKKNLQLVPTADWERYTPVENYLGNVLRSGRASKKEVQQDIIDFKNGIITFDEIKSKYQ